jgi:Predicted hydrolases or acyltransferases (alpha/beta hydrolase superfamily)
MAKDIVMIHGANEGGWCFDQFKAVFAGFGWTCPAPDLIGHGLNADKNGFALVGVGIADYLNELETFLKSIEAMPVLLGHSTGAVLAQQLAAKGLVHALVLVCPAPRAGILPQTDGEKQLGQDLMGLGCSTRPAHSTATATCWCSSQAPRISRAASPDGFQVREAWTRSLQE